MANTPGTVRYPTNLDDLDSLVRPVNNLTPTTITDNPLTSGATTITVVSTTGYPATGILTIESEYVTYTGTTSTTFTGCARGAEGSSAAAHASGTAVNCFITAARHTVLANAIVAAETKVGGGASTPANNQVLAGNGTGTSAWTASPTVTSITTTTSAFISNASGSSNLVVAGSHAFADQVGVIEAQDATVANRKVTIGYDTSTEKGWIQALKTGTAYEPLCVNPNGGNVAIGGTTTTNTCQVNGTLGKTSGTFHIDHPDPAKHATHWLDYAFIEGPDYDLLFGDKGVIGADGMLAIDLDAYARQSKGTFAYLVAEEDAAVYVTGRGCIVDWTDVTDGCFTITGAAGTRVSWLVKARRDDPHVRDANNPHTDANHRLITEYEKERLPEEMAHLLGDRVHEIVADLPADDVHEEVDAPVHGYYGYPQRPAEHGFAMPRRTVTHRTVVRES